MSFRPGPRNLLTDVAGLRVGQARDDDLKSGVTAIICDQASPAGVQILGGAPGTRETDLLEPHNTVPGVNAIVLSGGSAFGLDAASGVQSALREDGVGFAVRDFRIPIVPAAIMFDLANGGNKDWGRHCPYRELGYQAARNASADFALGSEGAGTGALICGLKGGLGSASVMLESGITVAALAAVNAVGSVTVGDSSHFWAAPFEIDGEFGGLGVPPLTPDAVTPRTKFQTQSSPLENTTIAVIATDAVLDKAGARRLAIAAHDGFARAIWPAHTVADGDLVFGLATGRAGKVPDFTQSVELHAAAGAVMARAIARGVFMATPAPNDLFPTWSARR
jgi:L-aminopeptidase/D-esterase-like protein